MRLIVSNGPQRIGVIVLTGAGLVAEPQVDDWECAPDADDGRTPEEHRTLALHERAHFLNRILRRERAAFESRHPGGTDADFLRWCAETQPDVFDFRLEDDPPLPVARQAL